MYHSELAYSTPLGTLGFVGVLVFLVYLYDTHILNLPRNTHKKCKFPIYSQILLANRRYSQIFFNFLASDSQIFRCPKAPVPGIYSDGAFKLFSL